MLPRSAARPAFAYAPSAAFAAALADPPLDPEPPPRRAGVSFEIFAGSAGLSAALGDVGFETVAVDHHWNKHVPLVPVTPIDVAAAPGQAVLKQMLTTMRADVVWLAPPCGTFSRARDRALPAEALAAGARAPRPLRDDVYVRGLPTLAGKDLLRVTDGNALADFTADVAEDCRRRGRTFIIENPASSRLWALPAFARLGRESGVLAVDLHHCCFGGARPKRTRLLTNEPALRALARDCAGDHWHAPWGYRDDAGGWRFGTAEEAVYPTGLCEEAARILAERRAARAHAPAPLGATLGRLRGTRARRARPPHVVDAAAGLATAAGRQTRGRRPPLIPERPPPRPADDEQGGVAAAGEGRRQEQRGGGAGGEERREERRGGGTGDEERREGGRGEEGEQDEARCWTPPEFLDEAMALRHPVDVPYALQDGITDIIRAWAADRGDMQGRVLQQLAFWEERAGQLAPDEALIQERLHPDVRGVLAGKRLLLLDEMARAAGYVDERVAVDLARGFPLAGRFPYSGAFPRRAGADQFEAESLEWLGAQAPAVQEDLRRHLRRYPLEPDLAEEVGAATAKEVQAGWVTGPFTEAEVRDKFGEAWLPARRFGVRQGAKVRPIDDLSRNLVNAATEYQEYVVPTGVDAVVAMARAWADALRDAGGAEAGMTLGGKAFDLESAYKQCAVWPGHARFALFAYAAPDTADGPYLYRAAALPFGAAGSVVSFNRVARLLMWLVLRLLAIPVVHYFDDFPVLGPEHLWPFFQSALARFAVLLGWRWKAASIEKPFSSEFDVLGVRLLLARAVAAGRVEVTNTPRRVDELVAAIAAARARGYIEAHEAATLSGRLGYAGAQCFGRAGAAFLSALRAAGRATAPARIEGRLAGALVWWLSFLGTATPRILELGGAAPPVVVFGDGACDPGLNSVGVVLFDRASSTYEAIGGRIGDPAVRALRRAAGAEQVIGQLELIPAWLALRAWPAVFAAPGRRVLFFIDNDAARFGLIKGYSPSRASQAVIGAFWRLAAGLQIAPWFERVATDGNPADAPSRLDFRTLRALRPRPAPRPLRRGDAQAILDLFQGEGV